jgi:hypothetical protein
MIGSAATIRSASSSCGRLTSVRTLLEERYAPATSSVGFFEAPLGVVADAFESWSRDLPQFSTVSREELSGDLASTLETLSPLCRRGYTKDLCVAHGTWTAFFSNGVRGSDPGPPLRHIGRTLRCRTVLAQTVPHTMHLESSGTPGRQGAVQFYLRDPVMDTERGLSVTFDGSRGTFAQIGDPLSFESVDDYAARKIWDRFNSARLEQLCAGLGIQLFDPAAYGRAVRFDLTTVKDWGLDVVELADAQAALGIVPGQAATLPG